MRTAVSTLELLEPRSLEEALAWMASKGPLTPIAGCTDVYVEMNAGTLRPRRFLDLWGIAELRGVRRRGELLSIGALTTYAELRDSPVIRRRLPMLAAASAEVGGAQIQARGTIGGNLGNASPAGDALPPLAAADAVVVLGSARGERRVPVTSFFTGYRKSVKREDELILAVEIAPVAGKQWFRKVGTRAAQAISKVVMAAVRDAKPRIALGSVAPTVIRARAAEEALARGASTETAQRALLSEIAPIDDLRSTADYRRRVAANLLARFLRETG